ncbi:MAG: cation diffusion facilitator family transporter [Paludibacter sp.]
MNISKNEKRTLWVVMLTAITMLVEIFYGISTKSMALLADGIHMGSHVFAIGLSWIAYVLVRKLTKKASFTGDGSKILALSGYSSGLILLLFALFIMVEAVERFFVPQNILYNDAIFVAIVGLIVNIISARLLHHEHHESDHNIKAAYLHVLADALTSVSAIVGLIVAKYWNIAYVDPLVAIVSSLVIIKWSVGLLASSSRDLIDFAPQKQNNSEV